ncbi:hypothetical protein ACFXPN_26195 [Streptomyces griseorubiginosus]|uniref:hypothetical protein n=1 Tax=Streptomyces griseorubiginosus TaxID=67304 RepID=UPI00368886FC
MPDLVYAGQRVTADMLSFRPPYTVAYAPLAANTSTTTTTEAVAITTPSITFKNGRAYRITLKCLAQSSVSGDTVTLRVRKTDTSGTAYLDQLRKYIPANGANTPEHFSNIATNTTGSDVTAVLVATYQRASGTGNALIAASANNIAYVLVEDVGPAGDYSSAQAIS